MASEAVWREREGEELRQHTRMLGNEVRLLRSNMSRAKPVTAAIVSKSRQHEQLDRSMSRNEQGIEKPAEDFRSHTSSLELQVQATQRDFQASLAYTRKLQSEVEDERLSREIAEKALSSSRIQYESRLKIMNDSYDHLQRECVDLRSEIDQQSVTEAALRGKISQLEASKAQMQEELSANNSKLSTLEMSCSELVEIVDELRGRLKAAESAKSLEKSGMAGIVAELARTNQDQSVALAALQTKYEEVSRLLAKRSQSSPMPHQQQQRQSQSGISVDIPVRSRSPMHNTTRVATTTDSTMSPMTPITPIVMSQSQSSPAGRMKDLTASLLGFGSDDEASGMSGEMGSLFTPGEAGDVLIDELVELRHTQAVHRRVHEEQLAKAKEYSIMRDKAILYDLSNLVKELNQSVGGLKHIVDKFEGDAFTGSDPTKPKTVKFSGSIRANAIAKDTLSSLRSWLAKWDAASKKLENFTVDSYLSSSRAPSSASPVDEDIGWSVGESDFEPAYEATMVPQPVSFTPSRHSGSNRKSRLPRPQWTKSPKRVTIMDPLDSQDSDDNELSIQLSAQFSDPAPTAELLSEQLEDARATIAELSSVVDFFKSKFPEVSPGGSDSFIDVEAYPELKPFMVAMKLSDRKLAAAVLTRDEFEKTNKSLQAEVDNMTRELANLQQLHSSQCSDMQQDLIATKKKLEAVTRISRFNAVVSSDREGALAALIADRIAAEKRVFEATVVMEAARENTADIVRKLENSISTAKAAETALERQMDETAAELQLARMDDSHRSVADLEREHNASLQSYSACKARLTELKADLQLYQKRSAIEQRQQEQELEDAKAAVVQVESSINSLKAQIEEVEAQASENDALLTELETKLHRQLEDTKSSQHFFAVSTPTGVPTEVHEARVTELMQRISQLEQQLDNPQLKQRELELAKKDEMVNALFSRISEMGQSLKAASERLLELEKSRDDGHQATVSIDGHATAADSSVSASASASASASERLQLQTVVDALTDENVKLNGEMQEFKEQLKEKIAECTDLEEQLSAQRTAVRDLSAQVEQEKDRASELNILLTKQKDLVQQLIQTMAEKVSSSSSQPAATTIPKETHDFDAISAVFSQIGNELNKVLSIVNPSIAESEGVTDFVVGSSMTLEQCLTLGSSVSSAAVNTYETVRLAVQEFVEELEKFSAIARDGASRIAELEALIADNAVQMEHMHTDIETLNDHLESQQIELEAARIHMATSTPVSPRSDSESEREDKPIPTLEEAQPGSQQALVALYEAKLEMMLHQLEDTKTSNKRLEALVAASAFASHVLTLPAAPVEGAAGSEDGGISPRSMEEREKRRVAFADANGDSQSVALSVSVPGPKQLQRKPSASSLSPVPPPDASKLLADLTEVSTKYTDLVRVNISLQQTVSASEQQFNEAAQRLMQAVDDNRVEQQKQVEDIISKFKKLKSKYEKLKRRTTAEKREYEDVIVELYSRLGIDPATAIEELRAAEAEEDASAFLDISQQSMAAADEPLDDQLECY